MKRDWKEALIDWRFETAWRRLPNKRGEHARLVTALARSYGNCLSVGGDTGVIIAAVVALILKDGTS